MHLKLDDQTSICELNLNDTDFFFELMNLPSVQEFIPDRFNHLEEMSECIQWLISNYSKKEFIRLTYKIIISDRFAGWISIGPLPFDESKKEIAYVIHPDYQRKGLASRCVKAFIQYITNTLLIHELYAEVNTKNIPSITILEKNHFIRKGDYFSDDSHEEKYIYHYIDNKTE